MSGLNSWVLVVITILFSTEFALFYNLQMGHNDKGKIQHFTYIN